MEGQGEVTRLAENFESGGGRRSREDEHESRSGSDNMDGGSGDDQDAADNPPRKKRYHRHTPQQIQELEAYDLMFHQSFRPTSSLVSNVNPLVLTEFVFVFVLVCSRSVLILMKSKGWSSAKGLVWRPGK